MTRQRRMSGFVDQGNVAEMLKLSPPSYGQNYPQHYPQPAEQLGLPLSVQDVAAMIGCSVWTVRQRYLQQGLPHLRSGPLGKLIFFRDQVIRWILERQQRGGT